MTQIAVLLSRSALRKKKIRRVDSSPATFAFHLPERTSKYSLIWNVLSLKKHRQCILICTTIHPRIKSFLYSLCSSLLEYMSQQTSVVAGRHESTLSSSSVFLEERDGK